MKSEKSKSVEAAERSDADRAADQVAAVAGIDAAATAEAKATAEHVAPLAVRSVEAVMQALGVKVKPGVIHERFWRAADPSKRGDETPVPTGSNGKLVSTGAASRHLFLAKVALGGKHLGANWLPINELNPVILPDGGKVTDVLDAVRAHGVTIAERAVKAAVMPATEQKDAPTGRKAAARKFLRNAAGTMRTIRYESRGRKATFSPCDNVADAAVLVGEVLSTGPMRRVVPEADRDAITARLEQIVADVAARAAEAAGVTSEKAA